MFRIRHERCAHSEDELWVYLDVSVNQNGVVLGLLPLEYRHVLRTLVIVQGPSELFKDCLAVGELDLSPQFGLRNLLIPEVYPLHLCRVNRPTVLR